MLPRPRNSVKESLGKTAGVQTVKLQSKSTIKIRQCLYTHLKYVWNHCEIADFHSRRCLHGIMGWKMTVLCCFEHPGITLFPFFDSPNKETALKMLV